MLKHEQAEKSRPYSNTHGEIKTPPYTCKSIETFIYCGIELIKCTRDASDSLKDISNFLENDKEFIGIKKYGLK